MSSYAFGIATTAGACNTPDVKVSFSKEAIKVAIQTIDLKLNVNTVNVKIKAECGYDNNH
jgi:hypothetical protein